MHRPRNVFFYSGLSRELGGIECSGMVLHEHLRHSQNYLPILYHTRQCPTVPLSYSSAWRLLAGILLRSWKHVDVAYFFHIGLLKLLPYMRLRGFRGKVGAYVHGIEAWRKLPPGQIKLLNSVHHLFANSEHTIATFRSFNPAVTTPIRIVTLGLGQSTTDTLPPRDDVPTAVILARMAKAEDYKGHRELIQAWPAVRARVPGAVLRVLGTGDLQPELAMLAQHLGVAEAIQFTGRVSEEQKLGELQAARCFLMPSRGEGLGLVYFEAMRLGRPCLVSYADAGQEVVRPPLCGLGVDVTDSTAVADAVVKLLTPGSCWEEWSAQAKTRYDENYTEEKYFARFSSAFRDAYGVDLLQQQGSILHGKN